MNGSKSTEDRLFLLNKIDKILFNSEWSQERFFIGIDNKKLLKQKTSVCYQSTNRTKINFSNKKKLISFIGKLNSAKGYDIFGKTIIKILNKYKNWKAVVIGDEPREKLYFEHKNLKIYGYVKHDDVLNMLKKVSISVVCSRWEEPFGRTSLEAASRGCAVIISNRGGLPETSTNAIILKNLSSDELYKTIENLILDKKRLEEMGIKYHKTNRGGDITYHGPGQLVCYPILDLENFYRDIHKYLRDLEDVVINTLDYFNISASGNSKETGVWLDVGKPNERKICAMGIKVSRWVTMHGLALNVNTNLSYFNGIVPCGISEKGVTSISNELNKTMELDLVRKVLTENFLKKFS